MRVYEGLAEVRHYPCFVFYQDTSGEWRWRLYARNKKVVADSGEGYTQKKGVKKAITRLWALLNGVGQLLWPT